MRFSVRWTAVSLSRTGTSSILAHFTPGKNCASWKTPKTTRVKLGGLRQVPHPRTSAGTSSGLENGKDWTPGVETRGDRFSGRFRRGKISRGSSLLEERDVGKNRVPRGVPAKSGPRGNMEERIVSRVRGGKDPLSRERRRRYTRPGPLESKEHLLNDLGTRFPSVEDPLTKEKKGTVFGPDMDLMKGGNNLRFGVGYAWEKKAPGFRKRGEPPNGGPGLAGVDGASISGGAEKIRM